ncbi:hypothetical protein [Serinibacter salmoneus]|uniref:hypothetical protein n=1 Tax=Serinibacter salmoneus TaxID=556530 RepID=UPI00117A2D07|nr:hypothetical protein [Serinibacter salmoneus]
MAAAATMLTLTGCSGGDADTRATATSAEATTSIEPRADETTATPTASETSQWTPEEAALIEEAEAFYLEANDLYIAVAQAGFTGPETNELFTRYSGAAREALHAEMLESAGKSITLEGEPTTVSVTAHSVSAGQEPEVVLDHCLDTSEIEFLIAGETQPEAPPGGLRVLRDRLVMSGGVWTINERIDYRVGSCEW